MEWGDFFVTPEVARAWAAAFGEPIELDDEEDGEEVDGTPYVRQEKTYLQVKDVLGLLKDADPNGFVHMEFSDTTPENEPVLYRGRVTDVRTTRVGGPKDWVITGKR